MKNMDGGVGPFTLIFGNGVARVLDQALIVGGMEQTLGMLAESTGLSYKTVKRAVERLEALGLVRHTRRVGNARAYAFQVERLRDFLRSAQDLVFRLEKREETPITTREETVEVKVA